MSEQPPLRLINVPENYAGLACQPLPDGDVRIHLYQRGESKGFFECSEAELASVASLILQFAHDAAMARGRQPSDETKPLISPVIQASRLGLAPHDHPEFQTLTVQVGEAMMGFAVHSSFLMEAGRAFQAAAAPEGKPN